MGGASKAFGIACSKRRFHLLDQSGRVIEKGENYEPPHRLTGGAPQIPAGVEFSGTPKVILDFEIGVDGNVSNIRVATTTGDRRLDEAAMAAVREWKYEPAVLDGKPIAVFNNVTVTYQRQ